MRAALPGPGGKAKMSPGRFGPASMLLPVGFALAAFLPDRVRWPLVGLWVAANALLAVSAAGWGLFHPRLVFSAWPAAVRWAFGLTALGFLFSSSGLDLVRARLPVLAAVF